MKDIIIALIICFVASGIISVAAYCLTQYSIKNKNKTTKISPEQKRAYLQFQRKALLKEIESIDLELNEININEQNK